MRPRSKTVPNLSIIVPELTQLPRSPSQFKRLTAEEDLKALSARLADTPPNTASFKLENELGHGTFGQVFSVTDIESRERSAIKVQSKHRETDSRIISEHEIEILELLKEKNVRVGPEIKDNFQHEDDHHSYIVLDLWEDTVDFNSLTPAEKEEATIKLREKLDKIHSIGIIHNDLRLRNILFRRVDGEIIVGLIDWGESINLNDDSYASGSRSAAIKNEILSFREMII